MSFSFEEFFAYIVGGLFLWFIIDFIISLFNPPAVTKPPEEEEEEEFYAFPDYKPTEEEEKCYGLGACGVCDPGCPIGVRDAERYAEEFRKREKEREKKREKEREKEETE